MEFLKRIWWGFGVASLVGSGLIAYLVWALSDGVHCYIGLFYSALIAFWGGAATWDLWYRFRASV